MGIQMLQDLLIRAWKQRHSELRAFIQKRPAILIEFAKSESKDKCHLSDETAADKAWVPKWGAMS